eukprot:TRINITY_DN10307_c0_g1_i1.p1 TRINITY_DN10307_c0_g1~~TRINITY_DN10307_c0_g1_i1.p1  ORF type:complete len:321 (+),score=92.65 TRINITY_DN10307_c0_g1_i1:130-1092(+)
MSTPRLEQLRKELSILSTESVNKEFGKIDEYSSLEIAQLMNQQDATVPLAVGKIIPQIALAVDDIVSRLTTGGRLIYAGAGTAGRLGVLDASECPPTFNVPSTLVIGIIAGGDIALRNAVEGAEDDVDSEAEAELKRIGVNSGDIVVGISASGRTPYAVKAVKYAKSVGAITIGIACNDNSELGRAADHNLQVVVGPEIVAGSTRLKAGTCQKLVLNMLTTISMIRMGKTYGNLMVDLRSTNEKLRARSWTIVQQATGASDAEVENAMESFGGQVKPAILSLLTGAMHVEVLETLEMAGGRLKDAMKIISQRETPLSPGK